MGEFTRRDRKSLLETERSATADPESVVKPHEPVSSGKPEHRALVTPPPPEAVANRSVTSIAGTATAPAEERTPLFALTEANGLRSRWDSVQVGFVDEPRNAVQEADALVSTAMKRLAEIFAGERQKLEQQWD